MSRKKEKVYLSQSASFETEKVDLENFTRVSVQTVVTNAAALNASIVLQLSNDYESWVDVADTTTAITANGTNLFDVETGAGFARVKITFTGGSADFEFDWVMK